MAILINFLHTVRGEGAAYAISVDGNLYAGAAYWTSPPPSSLCLQAPSLQPPVSLKDKTSQKNERKKTRKKTFKTKTFQKPQKKHEEKKQKHKRLYHLPVQPPASVNKLVVVLMRVQNHTSYHYRLLLLFIVYEGGKRVAM